MKAAGVICTMMVYYKVEFLNQISITATLLLVIAPNGLSQTFKFFTQISR